MLGEEKSLRSSQSASSNRRMISISSKCVSLSTAWVDLAKRNSAASSLKTTNICPCYHNTLPRTFVLNCANLHVRFWGVFWIDGRSHDQLKQTLIKNVAYVGGVDLNYNAALHWLSNQDRRWLLIIDNADNPAIDLHEYFPRGGKGYVLITTRNPSFTRLGNISPGHLEFKGMRPNDATNLLIKTSGYPPSLAAELGPVPSKIVDTLGYLALAISVAGSAIREGVCRFQDYLKYYEEMSKERFRSLRRTSIKASDDFEENRCAMTMQSESLITKTNLQGAERRVDFRHQYKGNQG